MTEHTYPIVTPLDNRKPSAIELSLAKQICDESQWLVQQRDAYTHANDIDARFAMPDANWSYESPNEFMKLYLRIVGGEKVTIQHLRGFCQVFSGYNLYKVIDGKGLVSADMVLSASLNEEIAESLALRNSRFVDEWLSMIEGIPLPYILVPPVFLGECGHLVNGVVVNSDTVNYQERVNIIYRSGLGDWLERALQRSGEIRICEIGGGYGPLASWFKKVYPNCSYTVVDLPECLLFSRLYLSLNRPDVSAGAGLQPQRFGFRFVPNYMAEKLDDSFDLVINTLSMSEMSLHQVEKYVDLMKRFWLRDGGLFFEQNQDNRHMNLLCAQDVFSAHFPERVNLNDKSRRFRNGMPNIWSDRPIDLSPNAVRRVSVELVEDLGQFNLVRAGETYWGLRKDVGPIDPLKLETRDHPPTMFCGDTAEEVKTKLRA